MLKETSESQTSLPAQLHYVINDHANSCLLHGQENFVLRRVPFFHKEPNGVGSKHYGGTSIAYLKAINPIGNTSNKQQTIPLSVTCLLVDEESGASI
ncbi:hypothetical protein [Shewanella surugensis]|uniref:Uncharacterized protein n=1 Tax=Shewanella surugensis TaxID=212020 RepID=A0ABT0L9U1_9GAMM|nr:hypothetical protein [Shewanella surugensis]MCL1124462.1 hypothetical protein [Shewanella surugensis]